MSFKILKTIVVGCMSAKSESMPALVLLIPTTVRIINKFAFPPSQKDCKELCDWFAKYDYSNVCMESAGKYWIPFFNILKKNNIWVPLSHPKYTKPQKGNKTDRKDAKLA